MGAVACLTCFLMVKLDVDLEINYNPITKLRTALKYKWFS